MPFTALKRPCLLLFYKKSMHVVRRLMPFTALKHHALQQREVEFPGSCAPPNAVYGIETSSSAMTDTSIYDVVRRLMPFTALKLEASPTASSVIIIVVRRLMPFTALKLHKCQCVWAVMFKKVVRRLMPFTALKLFLHFSRLFKSLSRCALPNAVYGIETYHSFHYERKQHSCAPPNAVYGIETSYMLESYWGTFQLCAA